ncbi:MAG: MotA/TolQ/ExbB proton channel family protein [Gammaproteobacteria bacterium]
MKIQEQEHHLMLVWLIITGLIIFGLAVCWDQGLISALIDGDQSRICLVIGLLYVIGTLHCAGRIIYLSRELNAADETTRLINHESARGGLRYDGKSLTVGADIALPESAIGSYLTDVLSTKNRESNVENSNLTEAFAEHLKGSHEAGWFIVDILLKLGLVGTIIGFILMLGSIADTSSLDVNTMQKVLKQMSSGMGTALFTTLAGLIGSMLLGLQYLLADKSADELIRRSVLLAELQPTYASVSYNEQSGT